MYKHLENKEMSRRENAEGLSRGGKMVVILQPGPGTISEFHSKMGYWNMPLPKGKFPFCSGNKV